MTISLSYSKLSVTIDELNAFIGAKKRTLNIKRKKYEKQLIRDGEEK